MFDGIFLQKIKDEIDFLKTGRINKINEISNTDFIFSVRRNNQNYNLIVSSSSNYSRIHLTYKEYAYPQNPKSFTMFLRKHIGGYFISDINTYSSDRIIIFSLEGYNELSDKSKKYLICEVMGRYSNLILTDDNYIILDALKHDGIGEYNRTILPHAKYEFPINNKLNPFDYSYDELKELIIDKKLESPNDYINLFNGVSLNLVSHIFDNDNHIDNFYNAIHADIIPSTFINEKNKLDFYFNPFNYEIINKYGSLSNMLDEFYFQKENEANIKIKTNDLSSFITRQIKKYEKKIIKLNEDLLDTQNKDKYRLYGELLLSAPNLNQKDKEIILFNYYDNSDIKIPLDNKITILDNSNKYFKLYQKCKNSISHINEQLEIASDELNYFNLLSYQLKDANINDALEIQDELIKNKYLFKNTSKNVKKKPTILTYIVDDTLIYVGKNNIQNDYITNHLAKKEDYWFHVEKDSGSHVVISSDNLTENLIRTAANLAAYFSNLRDSSSVPVDYTKIKNVKKIPGKKGCFVTYKNQKTIYIDPDINIIESLVRKK